MVRQKMAQADIDQLRIEVEASAGQASSSLAQLAADVRSLKSAVKGAAEPLHALADGLRAVKGVGSMAGSASGIRALADAARSLSGAKVSESIGNQIRNIADAANTADPQALASMATALQSVKSVLGGREAGAVISSNIATQMRAIAQSSAELAGVAPQMEAGAQAVSAVTRMVEGLASLPTISTNIGNQLMKVAKGARELSSVELPAEKVRELAESLSVLANIPKSALSSTVTAMTKLPQAAKALHSLDFKQLAEDCRRLSAALADLPERLANVAKGMDRLAKANAAANKYERMGGVGGLVNLAKLGMVVTALRRVGDALLDVTRQAGEFVEDMNLFTVAMGSYGQEAWSFAQRVNEALGINPQEWARGQGVFMSMAQGMGIASDKSALMSQQLTQLAYDLSSFYNIDVATAMEKVQAGLSGQLRPLRELGYDLSDARIKQDALTWGITKSVDEMTQGEKAMLRYREMIEQVNFVHGDMARTVKSPMNQMRILASTVKQAAVAWGGVLLPALNAVLSVLIPIAQALANVGNMLASLTGGKQMMEGFLAQLGTGGAGAAVEVEDAADAVDDVADATGDAGGAADSARESYEELKRTILGFDEINALKAVTDDVGGGSGGSGSKAGKGAGDGDGGMIDFELPTYDFLGNAKGAYKEALDAIMDFVDRVRAQLEPLYDAFVDAWHRIAESFEGVDLLGSFQGVLVSAVALVSNWARNAIEALTPVWVALEVPKVVKDGLDTLTQLFLTLSEEANFVGAAMRGFVEEGIVPLASWLSGSLRSALSWVREELRKFGQWFRDNTAVAYDFGVQVGRVFDTLTEPIRYLVDLVLDFAGNALSRAFEGMRQLATNVLNELAPAIRFVADCFDQIKDAAAPAIEMVKGFLQEIERMTGISFGDFMGSLVSGITELVHAATVAITGIVAVVTDLVTFLSDPFGFDFGQSATARWFDEFVMGNQRASTSTDGLTAAGRRATSALDAEQRSLDSIATTGSQLGTRVVGGINSKVASAGEAGANLVGSATKGLADAVARAGANLEGAKIGDSFGSGVSSRSASVTGIASGVSASVNAALGSGKAAASAQGSAMVGGFASAISGGASTAVRAAKEVAQKAQQGIKPEPATKYGNDLSTSLGNGITGAMSVPVGAARSLAQQVTKGAKPGDTSGYGRDVSSAMASGISGGVHTATNAAQSLARQVTSAAKPSDISSVGSYVVQGLANGISGSAHIATSAARAVADSVRNTISSALRIGSPSRLTEQYGRWVDEGLANGIDGSKAMPLSAASDMANGTADAIRAAMGSGALDSGPTVDARVSQEWSGQLDLDWERLTEAVAQGMLEGAVAAGPSSQGAVATGGQRELVMMVDGQALGRVVVDSLADMSARGYAPLDLMGVW